MLTYLAEDDIVTRHLLQTLLSRWGYTVQTASDGVAADVMLQSLQPPAIVMLDWMMPGAVGPDVCRKLRQAHPPHDAYVIMLTALNQPEDIVEGLEAGIDDYLPKPVTPVELRTRLQIGSRIITLERQLISARKSLDYEITHDELTGLLSREAVLKVLSEHVEHSVRENLPLGVALVKLDSSRARSFSLDFEAALIGEAAESLVAASQGALKSIRMYDVIGRFSDCSFLVIFPGVGRNGATNLSIRLLAGLTGNSGILPMCVNIGVTTSEGSSNEVAETLILAAERALRRSVSQGPNTIEYSGVTEGLILPSQMPELATRH
jgi:two-component system, cell cycle response regulator